MEVYYNDHVFEWESNSKSKLVKVDGVVNKDWEPIFTENGEDLISYGFHNIKTGESIDYLGNKLDITDVDTIKI